MAHLLHVKMSLNVKVFRMATLINQSSLTLSQDKALKIIAKSLYRELRENGYDSKHIVSLSTELIDLVTSELKRGSSSPVISP